MDEKLNLGCYKDILPGYINHDQKKFFPGIDIAHDLNIYPYPFKTNQFSEVRMKNILEHVDNPLKAITEIYRICKNKAIIKITVPYGNNMAKSIDHNAMYTECTFLNLCSGKWYGDFVFEIVKMELIPTKIGRYIPFRNIIGHFLNNIIEDIYVELAVIKD